MEHLTVDQIRESTEKNIFLVQIEPLNPPKHQVSVLAYGKKFEGGDGVVMPCGMHINLEAESFLDAVAATSEDDIASISNLFEDGGTIGGYMATRYDASYHFSYCALTGSPEAAMEKINEFIAGYVNQVHNGKYTPHSNDLYSKPARWCLVFPSEGAAKNLSTVKSYKIPVTWQMQGCVDVESDSIEDAIEQVKMMSLPIEQEYVTGSYAPKGSNLILEEQDKAREILKACEIEVLREIPPFNPWDCESNVWHWYNLKTQEQQAALGVLLNLDSQKQYSISYSPIVHVESYNENWLKKGYLLTTEDKEDLYVGTIAADLHSVIKMLNTLKEETGFHTEIIV